MSESIKKLFPKNAVEILFLLPIFSLALGIRIYLLFEYPHVVFLHEADAMGYFAIAKSIVGTWGLGDSSVHFPPFYPFVITLVSLFGSDIEISGRLASSIMGSLLIFPIYLISKELYDKRVAYLSVVISAFLGTFVDFSLQPLSQMTYLMLITTILYLGIVSIKTSSPITYFILGLTGGAAYLTRPEGLVAFIFVALVGFTAAFFQRSISIKQRLAAASLMLFGFLILALPYINYLHNQTGTWTISGKAALAVIGVDKSAQLLPTGKTLGESLSGKVGVGAIFQDPTDFIKSYQKNFITFMKVIPQHFSISDLFLVLLGLTISTAFIWKTEANLRTTKMLQNIALFGGIAAVLPVFAVGLSFSVSYILPIFPLFIIWLSRGIIGIEDGFWDILKFMGFSKIYGLKKWAIASTLFILFFSYSSISPQWKELSSNDFRYFAASQSFFLKDTGLWLKSNTPKDSSIMSRWGVMGFYADRKWVYIPDGEIPEVVKYAKEHNVRYIVVDSNAVPLRRPKLAPLLNLANYDGLRPVYAREEYWIRVVIYEVL